MSMTKFVGSLLDMHDRQTRPGKPVVPKLGDGLNNSYIKNLELLIH